MGDTGRERWGQGAPMFLAWVGGRGGPARTPRAKPGVGPKGGQDRLLQGAEAGRGPGRGVKPQKGGRELVRCRWHAHRPAAWPSPRSEFTQAPLAPTGSLRPSPGPGEHCKTWPGPAGSPPGGREAASEGRRAGPSSPPSSELPEPSVGSSQGWALSGSCPARISGLGWGQAPVGWGFLQWRWRAEVTAVALMALGSPGGLQAGLWRAVAGSWEDPWGSQGCRRTGGRAREVREVGENLGDGWARRGVPRHGLNQRAGGASLWGVQGQLGSKAGCGSLGRWHWD